MSRTSTLATAVLLVVAGGCSGEEATTQGTTNPGDIERVGSALETSINGAGFADTVHTSGTIDHTNPFFQALGTNPRTCETCHSSAQGWTLNASAATRLFFQTEGLAPLFMLHDTGSR